MSALAGQWSRPGTAAPDGRKGCSGQRLGCLGGGRFDEQIETVRGTDRDVISASKLEEVKSLEQLTFPRPALEPRRPVRPGTHRESEAYAGAKTSAAGGITDEGIKGEAAAFVGAEASAKGTADAGTVGAYARAEAKAGAEAGVSAGAGLDGLHAGAEAFAGAKAAAASGADIGGIGAGGTAEGWAGIGAEAEADLGKGTDGKWHVGAKAGVALGLGGEVGFEVTVDPGKISDTASDAADAVGDAADWVGDGVDGLF